MTTHPTPAAVAALLALAEKQSLPWTAKKRDEDWSVGWDLECSHPDGEARWIGNLGADYTEEEVVFICAAANLAPQLAQSWLQMRAALEGVLKSYEAHVHLREPKPEDEMDEYDYAMRPLWEAARAALADAPGTGEGE